MFRQLRQRFLFVKPVGKSMLLIKRTQLVAFPALFVRILASLRKIALRDGVLHTAKNGTDTSLQFDNIFGQGTPFSDELLVRGSTVWDSDQLFASRREANTMFMQQLRRKGFLFPKQAKQNVLSADVPTRKLISFLGCINQHTFAYAAEWEVREVRNLLKDWSTLFDLSPD
jgi:hypothetical protein